MNTQEIPYGYCHCGCGQKTTIAKYSDHRRGTKKGEPYPFVAHHKLPHPVNEKFWEKVDKRGPDDCWLWTAKKLKKGYGVLGVTRKHRFLAHRFSYELHFGPIPSSMEVCHSCDNPSCVNPSHLWAGTHKENMGDMHKKGRARYRYGESHPNSRLTIPQVKEIRRKFETGQYTKRALAKIYGVGPTCIHRIIHRITYRNI